VINLKRAQYRFCSLVMLIASRYCRLRSIDSLRRRSGSLFLSDVANSILAVVV
jgi:hypothetical protein